MSRFPLLLPFGPDHKVVELGGGDSPRFHPNVDIRTGPAVDVVLDLGTASEASVLPSHRGIYDGVYSCYALEHVSWRQVGNFLKLALTCLKPGGHAVFIIPNLIEQAKYILAKEAAGEFGDNEVCCIFGDQNYAGADWRANCHSAGFSPVSAIKLFNACGFADVIVSPHPDTDTDMVVEARKPAQVPLLSPLPVAQVTVPADNFTIDERRAAYGHDYFNGGGKFGGYAHEGYWDYPVHRLTAAKIMELKPESVLELGPARGYVLKQLEDQGVRCMGLEASRHCCLTRVTDAVDEFDITQFPWPLADKAFDLCFSNAVMEHIPARYVAGIMAEAARVCRRGLHSISFKDDDDGFDKTHCNLRHQAAWEHQMPAGHVVVDKEVFERGPIPPTVADGKTKLNLGCYTTMFAHGWLNIDILDVSGFAQKYGFKFRQMDLGFSVDLPPESVALIFSSHMLEHLPIEAGLHVLKECYRVMRPGATMRLTLPDTRLLAELYSKGRFSALNDLFPQTAVGTVPDSMKFWNVMFDGHKAAYDHESIMQLLKAAGFTSVRLCGFRQGHTQILRETQESLPELSMFVEAVK